MVGWFKKFYRQTDTRISSNTLLDVKIWICKNILKLCAGFTARSTRPPNWTTRPPHCTSSHCFTKSSAHSSSSHVFSIKDVQKQCFTNMYLWKSKERKGEVNLHWCTFITNITCPYFEIEEGGTVGRYPETFHAPINPDTFFSLTFLSVIKPFPLLV